MGPLLKRKRSIESWEDLSLSEEVRSFKRVRILSNVKKARKAAFTSWEDRMSWVMTGDEPLDTDACDDGLGTSAASTAEAAADFKDLLSESIILSGASYFPRTKDERPEETISAHTSNSEEDFASGFKKYRRAITSMSWHDPPELRLVGNQKL